MPTAIFGNHSSVIVPREDRDAIGRFYCEQMRRRTRDSALSGNSSCPTLTSTSRLRAGSACG
jgi:hypothetical protein